ncbi:hypothetical protein NPIL_523901 [Nephila pilipes]|uniref:Uncharacterized protein n=1 Tax=Nephila pilipes TaxID=299642 RepID=A0A8X6R1N5_NEPPI|nr:hypothetical protein NPIL_523901 [Nephila pilipes]
MKNNPLDGKERSEWLKVSRDLDGHAPIRLSGTLPITIKVFSSSFLVCVCVRVANAWMCERFQGQRMKIIKMEREESFSGEARHSDTPSAGNK